MCTSVYVATYVCLYIIMYTGYSASAIEKSRINLKHSYKKKIDQIISTKWKNLGNPSLHVEVTIVKAKFLLEGFHEKYAMGLVERPCVTIEELIQDGCGKVILIEGDPGTGKTTLTIQICKKWANNELLMDSIVLLIPLYQYTSVTTIGELFKQLGYPDLLDYAQHNSGNNLTLLLDGWDEICEHQETASFFHDIIFGKFKELIRSTIIVTSRPNYSREIAEHTNSYHKILGFDKYKAIAYIEGYLHNDPSSAKVLVEYLKSHEYLRQHFYIPTSIAIMCFVCCFNDKQIPPTLSKLYEHFVVLYLNYNVHNTFQHSPKFKTIHDISEKAHPMFHKLCKIAFDMLNHNKLVFYEKDLEVPQNNLQLQQFDEFGLLRIDYCINSYATIEASYSFIHPAIQELLAAIFILKTSKLSISDVLDKYFCRGSNLMNVFPFLFGLVPKELLTPLAKKLIEIFNKSNRKDELLSSILHCLFEAHDETLCHEFARMLDKNEVINSYMHTFLDCHYACYFIAVCGVKRLNVSMCRCDFMTPTNLYCDTIAKYLQNKSADIASFCFNVYGTLSYDGMQKFANTLSFQPNLLSLELIGSCIPGCLKILCDSICKNNYQKITNLRLPNAKLNNDDLESIGSLIAMCLSLESLYIWCKPSEGVCLSMSFCKALRETKSLQKLVVPWWILSQADSEMFGGIISQNCSLKELWINVATADCLDPILNGLSSNTSITRFRIWLDKTGTFNTLGQCLNNCLTLNHTLKVIDFNDPLSMLRPPLYIPWSSSQVISICHGLCALNTTVVTLDISGCYIDAKACDIICSMLTKNTILQHLFLNPTYLEKQGAIDIINSCMHNTTLKLLSLIQWPLKKLLHDQGKDPFQFSTDKDVELAVQQIKNTRQQKNKPILQIYWLVIN